MSDQGKSTQGVITLEAGGGRPNAALTGREGVLADLTQKLSRAKDGQGSKIALVGESGMGKSRLASELAEIAQHEGVLVASIPYRGSKLRPYEPMAEFVQTLLGIDPELRAEARRLPLAQGLEALGLSRFEPTFARLLRIEGSGPNPNAAAYSAADVRPASTLDGPLDEFDYEGTVQDMHVKFELGDMLSMILEAAASQGKTILLVFEDLDEAAEISRTTALRVLQHIEQFPVLALATYKPSAPRDLNAAFQGQHITLHPLGREAALELASSSLGMTWMSKELQDVVWDAAGGNPLLLEMLMEFLRDAGRLTLRKGDQLGDITGQGDIPAHKKIVVTRIRRLPPELMKTMLYAVVLGDGFRVGALGVLHESRREEELLADLEALINLGLMEKSGVSRRAVFRFCHAVVRDTLYETAPADRRAHMHQRAGEYYALPQSGRRPRTESVIYHFARAGETDRALATIDEAIQKAYQEESRDEVVALYQEALNILGSDPERAKRRNEIAEALGDMHIVSGDYEPAAHAYIEAEFAEASPHLQAKIALALLAIDPQQAVILMSRLAPGVPLEYADDLRWRLEAGQAWGLSLLGRTYDAVRKSRDALGTLSSAAGFGSARTLMRGALGMALYYHGDQAEAHPHLESARAGWGARGDDQGVVFINQILVGMPKEQITKSWLDLVLRPLVRMT